MSKVLLCNISDAHNMVEEEKLLWTFDVLEALGVPEEVYEAEDINDFRYDMDELGIEVEYITNGCVNIYRKHWLDGPTEEQSGWLPVQEEHLVAQWKEPTYHRKIDDKGVYYEIHLNEWSVANMRPTR